MAGRVLEINISAQESVLPAPVDSVEVLPGQGPRGDRYFLEEPGERNGKDLTLIAAEALEALREEAGIELSAAESRRNVLTRGIDLNELVGKRFKVGEVECLGRLLNEPCTHLESLTQPGVLRGLVHRGGLRADVLRGGRIRIGDPVTPLA
jgi:MOSC domain-containing protein YiiM